ncbi:hypothetical protein BDZ90DRAFT_100482 [Jaminaea rosea]|uniref:Uncharacterized protein n=1 Tax=Jaminaea rosea TaxID=1569628 RepID=A0A316UI85_9BASI|nr:hypothetical protein BDZ90DRAFT_100482 [Jaminaea rosea]PWN24588.1 hypothetical protein BDZ90DRAFT_100482 [Jaminaea rosea]
MLRVLSGKSVTGWPTQMISPLFDYLQSMDSRLSRYDTWARWQSRSHSETGGLLAAACPTPTRTTSMILKHPLSPIEGACSRAVLRQARASIQTEGREGEERHPSIWFADQPLRLACRCSRLTSAKSVSIAHQFRPRLRTAGSTCDPLAAAQQNIASHQSPIAFGTRPP